MGQISEPFRKCWDMPRSRLLRFIRTLAARIFRTLTNGSILVAEATFSWKERNHAIAALGQGPVEVLIIGGGAVGCSIAAHLAAVGISCALFEREDFAYGASGNSTGLAHAGLR